MEIGFFIATAQFDLGFGEAIKAGAGAVTGIKLMLQNKLNKGKIIIFRLFENKVKLRE